MKDPISAVTPEEKLSLITVVSGNGQHHTARPDAKNPRSYDSLPILDIYSMIKNPPTSPKEQAKWAIGSSLIDEYSRKHSHQREEGLYHFFWGDLDELTIYNFRDVSDLVQKAFPNVSCLIYTTRSATEINPKSRIIFPLPDPVKGEDYEIIATIINDQLNEVGLTPDRASERPGQVCYLPNKGEYYEYKIIQGKPLNPLERFEPEIGVKKDLKREEQEIRKKKHEQALKRIQERINTGAESPVDAYKEQYPVELALEQYGYSKKGNKYLSPNSESGNAGVSIKDGKWYSHHSSDSNIGTNNGDGTWGDAFDLFVHYECGGDFSRAVRAAGEMFTKVDPILGDTVTLNKLNQRNHMSEQDTAMDDFADLPGENKENPKSDLEHKEEFSAGADWLDFDPASILLRDWIISGSILRGFVSILIAPGGVGKSSYTLMESMMVASGFPRSEALRGNIKCKVNTLLINNEDDTNELHRRVAGIMQYYDISNEDIHKKFFLKSGYQAQQLVCSESTASGQVVQTPLVKNLKKFLKEKEVGLLTVDPFVSTHQSNENDNMKMNAIIQVYKEICADADCAIRLVHHTRKGMANEITIESSRGGKALSDAARIGETLMPMPVEDAKMFGLTEEERNEHIRMDSAKANYTKRGEGIYFKMVSVQIANGEWVGVPFKADDLEAVESDGDNGRSDHEIFSILARCAVKKMGRDGGEIPWTDLSGMYKREAQVGKSTANNDFNQLPRDEKNKKRVSIITDDKKQTSDFYYIWYTKKHQTSPKILHLIPQSDLNEKEGEDLFA